MKPRLVLIKIKSGIVFCDIKDRRQYKINIRRLVMLEKLINSRKYLTNVRFTEDQKGNFYTTFCFWREEI